MEADVWCWDGEGGGKLERREGGVVLGWVGEYLDIGPSTAGTRYSETETQLH